MQLINVVSWTQVEVRLADKEEQSMEKELVYQQVSRLTDRLSAQVDAGKDDTLKLAKKVRPSSLHVVCLYR